MTNEEKQLLIKDLCARLPYGVMCNIQTRFVFEDGTLRRGSYDKILDLDTVTTINEWKETGELEKLKPYLRSMSSMTEEEESINEQLLRDMHFKPRVSTASHYMNFLYEHHIDFDGLIEKGLALPAPEGMYN